MARARFRFSDSALRFCSVSAFTIPLTQPSPPKGRGLFFLWFLQRCPAGVQREAVWIAFINESKIIRLSIVKIPWIKAFARHRIEENFPARVRHRADSKLVSFGRKHQSIFSHFIYRLRN